MLILFAFAIIFILFILGYLGIDKVQFTRDYTG